MAVGEVFLGAIISLLLTKLASDEFLKYFKVEGLGSQLKKCVEKLQIIQKVLMSNEERQDTDDAIEKWLDELQVVAMDMEDIVDELHTEALRLKLQTKHNQASTSKVLKFNISSFTTALGSFAKNLKMDSKTEKVFLRLDELVDQIKILNLVQSAVGNVRPSINQEKCPVATTSLVHELEIIGRKSDKEQIVERIRSTLDQSLSVIAIVGMGGIGKTTLAQLVYNDGTLKESFQSMKAWISVNGDFHVPDNTKTILSKLSSESDLDKLDLDSLQSKLRDTVSKKRLFLVLDDVWEQDYAKWESLFKPLMYSVDRGSKVIVTSREDRVPRILLRGEHHHLHRLTELKDEEALSLLARFAFIDGNFDSHPELKDLGQQLVNKCQKLPLAIKHLGIYLVAKPNPDDWKEVLDSEIWKTETVRNQVLPSLKLSYNRLPPHLKRCFGYCSIFPKGCEFTPRKLVLLWMAEGFLEHGKGMKSLEELGEDWFNELASRSFFEQSSSNSSMYVMHDLIHDLAQHVSRKICFVLKGGSNNDPDNTIAFARHSSYMRSQYVLFSKFEVFQTAMRIRTFLPGRKSLDHWGSYCLSNKVLVELLPKFECLRVLSLHGYEIDVLPDSIGNLKHLRYLDLSETKLVVLPESVTTLCNLQTLSLQWCRNLRKLPSGMRNLVSLRHLGVSGTSNLHEMPQEICELTSLRTLCKISISKTGGFSLKNLGSLPSLRGIISIMGLSNVRSSDDAMQAKLGDKSYFDIELSWDDYSREQIRDENLAFHVLESLRPNPTKLEVLDITNFGGSEFPMWVREPYSFSKLVDLRLNSARNCASLPSLGQLPSLKNLYIIGMGKVRTVGNEFYGGDALSSYSYFPSLLKLEFSDMEEWTEWSGLTTGGRIRKQFCQLQELSLRKCPKLIKVQCLSLPSLCRLTLDDCRQEIMTSLNNLTSLTEMSLKRIIELTCLSEALVQFPFALEKLTINRCEKLSKLWPIGDTAQNLKQLRVIEIRDCPQLLSVEGISSIPSLERLTIGTHPSMKNLFIGGKLPATLKHFTIVKCDHLEDISEPVLEECCNSLESLSIFRCSQFKLSALLGSTQIFVRLTMIEILGDGIESFPECGLSTPNLRDLFIDDCKTLKSLQTSTLPSLTHLRLDECRSMEAFPQEDLPPKLTYLEIRRCHMVKPLSTWGLHTLTSLTVFAFVGCDSNNIQETEFFHLPPTLLGLSISNLPRNMEHLTSLQSLAVYDCPKVENLLRNMEHLTSLQSLTLVNCPKVENLLRNMEHLASLQSLTVGNCPKVEYIPKSLQDLPSIRRLRFYNCPKLRSVAALEGLQDKLWSLEIDRCPVLAKRCSRKNKGKYSPFLANIPSVDIYPKQMALFCI